MKTLLGTATALLLSASLLGAESWSAPGLPTTAAEPYHCAKSAGDGAFELSAKIALDTIDGSAASIWFGDALNFGFDARSGGLFIEGGKVTASDREALRPKLLAPGELFVFSATRDATGSTTFAIDGEQVLQTNSLTELPLTIKFRPHRNTMKLQAITLVGDLIDVPVPRVPVLIEGGKWPATTDPNRRPAYPIHRRGEVDCHTTRIPALAKTNKGTLLGVYDLRYNSAKDLQEHMDIGLSRSADGGKTWEKPRPIMDMGEYGGKPHKENGCSDPNILVDPKTGRIFVSAVWTWGKPGTHQWVGKGSEPGFEIGKTAQFMVVTSDDDGVTWSEPQNWTRKLKKEKWVLFAPAPGNGIALEDGTLVMPTQGRDAEGLPFSNITWSKDGGETWTVSPPATRNTTESAVAALSDGSLLLNSRDNRNRKDKGDTNGRAMNVTKNLGESWERHPADHGALPEPVCMASMISHTMDDGRHLLLFSNPRDKHRRQNMTIQASLDDGKTWPEKHHVLLDTGRGKGYSSLVMVDDQTVGILYESSIANLVFQRVPLSDLGL